MHKRALPSKEDKVRQVLGLAFAAACAIAVNWAYWDYHENAMDILFGIVVGSAVILLPAFSISQVILSPLIWLVQKLRGRPSTLTWRTFKGHAAVVFILLLLVAVALPGYLSARVKVRCSIAQKMFREVTEAINYQMNHSSDLSETITVVLRHFPNRMDRDGDPFDPSRPGVVKGIKQMKSNSGQVALEFDPNDPMAVIVYRDLSWEPICGEPEPVQVTVRATTE